jgi:hypothetical protein
LQWTCRDCAQKEVFRDGRHDRRADRLNQLMMFVAFVSEFRPRWDYASADSSYSLMMLSPSL